MNGNAALPSVITRSGGRCPYLSRMKVAVRSAWAGVGVSRQIEKLCIDLD